MLLQESKFLGQLHYTQICNHVILSFVIYKQPLLYSNAFIKLYCVFERIHGEDSDLFRIEYFLEGIFGSHLWTE